MVLCFAANEFIYQVQVQILSWKSNITMINVFILTCCIITTMVRFVCSHSWGLYLCSYCPAVNVHWLGSYLFINNVFLPWYFCCKCIYLSSPGSNPVTKIKYYFCVSVHIGLLCYMLGVFVFMSILSSCKCTMDRFIY